MGGGMRCGSICGAISGGILVLGMLFPATAAEGPAGKRRITQQTQEYIRRFRERFVDRDCADLLKRKDLPGFRGKVMPILAILCSLFMVFAAIYSHKWNVLYYLIVFFVIEVIGAFFNSGRKA